MHRTKSDQGAKDVVGYRLQCFYLHCICKTDFEHASNREKNLTDLVDSIKCDIVVANIHEEYVKFGL